MIAVRVGDDPANWAAAGFMTAGSSVVLPGVEIRCVGRSAPETPTLVFDRAGWTGEAAPPAELDGIGCRYEQFDPADRTAAPSHPNGIGRLDHLVVFATSLDRVRSALAAHRLEIRRERSTQLMGAPAVQVFAWAGSTILEIVVPEGAADAPARVWGLAFEADDLDATAAWFGEAAGSIRPAVQPGRRILSLRHEALGFSLTAAVMSPHLSADNYPT